MHSLIDWGSQEGGEGGREGGGRERRRGREGACAKRGRHYH